MDIQKAVLSAATRQQRPPRPVMQTKSGRKRKKTLSAVTVKCAKIAVLLLHVMSRGVVKIREPQRVVMLQHARCCELANLTFESVKC